MIWLILASYICGSIPTAIWTGKLVKGIDIREHGSGNAGATNTFRVLGWKPALFVVFVDIGKGFIPTMFFATWFAVDGSWAAIIAGMSAVLGHVWTLFAGFRGGKGVGTAAGMLLALFPIAFPLCILVFALVVWLSGFVSLASILACGSLPIFILILNQVLDQKAPNELLYFSIALVPFVLFTHRSNIKRIIQGNEKSIKKTKSTKNP